MLIHPVHPGIILHSDDELGAILQCRITKRETIHEWPLSCVQSLCLENGTRLIYKAQLPPTVEPLFYEAAASRLLPQHRVLGRLGDCQTMTIEWIHAPLLGEIVRSDDELVSHGVRLVAQIGEIGGSLPIYLDIGSVGAWQDTCRITLEKLGALVIDGRFGLIDLDAVERIRAWAASSRVRSTISGRSHVAHGDLKADQVFVTDDGYRVVDWQRPVVAPPDLDLVSLLVKAGVDPRRFVEAEVVNVFWFLRLRWAVEAQFSLFPDSRWQVYDQWAAEAIGQILG